MFNAYIDHTGLKVDSGVRQLCAEAERYAFRGICVFPNQVNKARSMFDGKISTVISFPYGAEHWATKVTASEIARQSGADELDIVMDISAFLNKNYLKIVEELAKIVNVGLPVKVIVEEHYLSVSNLMMAHQIVKDSGAFCIKTSTGTVSGATLCTVALWKNLGDLKIKAAGGIHTSLQCRSFIEAGADIIGTSHGPQIMEEVLGWEDLKVNK